MTMTPVTRSIWEMCQDTFGRIPAQWRAQIEALDLAFTNAQLEEAFAITKHHQGNNIKYVVTCLGGLRDKAAAAAPAARPKRLHCDRCPRTDYVDRMTVHDGQAICERCAEDVRDRGALTPRADADMENVVVGRARLLELRAEQPCRIIGTPLRCNETPEEQAWVKRWYRLVADVRQAARRKAPYMPPSQLEAEVNELLAHRQPELGRYPARPDPLWAVSLRGRRAEEAAGGRAADGAGPAEPPMSANARYVAAYWAGVKRALGVEVTA